MNDGGGKCPTCEFQNPSAWRACAACGASLSLDVPAGAVQRPDSTIVDIRLPEADEAGDTDPGGPPLEGDEVTAEEQPAEPPLIGQAEASEAIRTGVERAFSIGAPTLVALEGTRESGKTRLLIYASEVAARIAPTVRVLYGACRRGDQGFYAPFARMLRERLGIMPSSSPTAVRGQMSTQVSEALGTKDAIAVAECTHLIGHVTGVPFPDSPFLAPLEHKPEERARRVVRAVCKIFEGDAQRRPMLLLLDDAQLMDADGWHIVSRLCESEAHISIVMAGEAPIAKMAAALDPKGGVAVGPVSPLIEDDVGAFLHVLLPNLTAVPEPLAAAIQHRSAGNPGAIRELTFELLESGLFQETGDSLDVDMTRLSAGDLPVTLEDAMLARIDRLDEFERATLERAAVMGESFWDGGVLAQMRAERAVPGDESDPASIWPNNEDLDALHAGLRRLADKGFVEPEETSDLAGAQELKFQLAGACALIYARMDAETRVRRHAAAARWLAVTAVQRRRGVAALIAPHLELAGMDARAGRAYLEAAMDDRAHARTERALTHVEKALPLLSKEDVVRRIDGLHEHGSLLTTVGRYDEAIEAFTEMLRLAWSIGARGKGGAAMSRVARVHRQRGDNDRAMALFQRALAMFRDAADVRGVASALDDLAQVHLLRSELELAVRAAAEALEIRRANADQRGEALSLSTLGSVELVRGNLERAQEFFEQSRALREEVGDVEGTMQSHNALGMVAFERGEAGDAVAAWRSALVLAVETGDARNKCFLLNNMGEALLSTGKLDEASEALVEARELAASLGDKRATAEVERNLGRLAVRQGGDAEEVLNRALELAEEYGGKDAIALAHRAIGEWRAETLFDEGGEPDRRAEESFLVSIDLFREIENEKEAARSLAALAYHLIERGEQETAQERLREARAIMRRMGLAELGKVERTLDELD